MQPSVPAAVQKYFWGDDLNELSWPTHKKYIVQTLLEKGDLPALKWLFTQISKNEVKHLLSSLRLPSKSSNFWQIYLT